MNVMIGVDPHKASHTAVAIGRDEDQIASVKVRTTHRQVDQLLTWAEPFEKRTWAIESVGGMGYLLAQQLVARGENVLDVPAGSGQRRPGPFLVCPDGSAEAGRCGQCVSPPASNLQYGGDR